MEESNLKSEFNELFSTASWFQFELLILIIIAVLLSIRLLIFVFDNLSHQSRLMSRMRDALQFILDHIEPFIIVLLFGYFISIDPFLHGLIALVLCIGGYRQIRDYITGKALKYTGALVSGGYLTVGSVTGEIGKLRRLGVQVVSRDATHFFSYINLYDQGFTIHANDAFGGYYPMTISKMGDELDMGKLKRIIINSPFTDEFGDIRISKNRDRSNEVNLSVHLRNSDHLDHLKELLKTKGYDCGE